MNMLATAVLLSAWAQAGSNLIDGPVPPVGISRAFQERSIAIQRLCGQGAHDQAKALLWTLPKQKFTVEWQGTNLPNLGGTEYLDAVDKAIENWRTVSQGGIVQGARGDLVIRYADTFATDLKFGSTPSEPRLIATFPLKRGDQKSPVTPVMVQNDAAFAIGAYYGVAPHPVMPSVMARTDNATPIPLQVMVQDMSAASIGLQVVEVLKLAIDKKFRYKAGEAKAAVEFNPAPVYKLMQGDKRTWTMPIKNEGTANLIFKVSTDCGCMAATPGGVVKPGETVPIQLLFDSTMFGGELLKRVIISTNDPAFSTRIFEFKHLVTPRYDIYSSRGDVIVLDSDSDSIDLFVRSAIKGTGEVTRVDSGGISAQVTHQKVSAPEESGMFPFERITIKVDGSSVVGRQQFSVSAYLDDPKYDVISKSLFIQKGIAAIPSEVYFGTLGTGHKTMTVEVARPGKAFKIKNLKSTSGAVVVTAENGLLADSHKIKVEYIGAAKAGSLQGAIEVETDDPKQKFIVIPLKGQVR